MKLTQSGLDNLQIQIKDDGPGIDEGKKQRVFEPFYTTKVKGTGLGLAVVNSVVRAHSGYIQCESTKGSGTLFTLLIPCINQYITTSGCGNQQREDRYEAI
jgi:two-component system sensor histidine kinase FlrB